MPRRLAQAASLLFLTFCLAGCRRGPSGPSNQPGGAPNTDGVAMDVTSMSRLSAVNAVDGLLMDLDFTGKLDLITVTANANEVRVFRQFGPLLFNDITSASGIPASLHDARTVMMEDWSRDGSMDVIAGRKEGPPLLLEKQRGGPLVPREMPNWVAGAVFCAADFDNDLRPDLAVVNDGKISICFNGGERKEIAFPGSAIGEKMRVWRNRGLAGFEEQTAELGLDKFDGGPGSEIHFADFDMDCDPDVILALASGGLRYLRNEGGPKAPPRCLSIARSRSSPWN